jgi:hypothetical protein
MSGRKSKRKGDRIERDLDARNRALGLAAQRVPLPRAAGGHFAREVLVPGLRRIAVAYRIEASQNCQRCC